MSFVLLPTLLVILGAAALALLLWALQRLRVQHRQVEVLSTLFWRAAVEETRARVFVKRFRHWPAWLLLVAIASLLWMLFAKPQIEPINGMRHVVMLDWSVDDPEIRELDLRLAMERADSLPQKAREVVAVGDHLERLLAPGEPTKLVRLRVGEEVDIGAEGTGWAIETFSALASEQRPLTIHLVGAAELETEHLDALGSHVTIQQIDREIEAQAIGLTTLGIAPAASGRWDAVDLWFAFSGIEAIDPKLISIFINGSQSDEAIEQRGDQSFQLSEINADGSEVSVQYDAAEIGVISLPKQDRIRVSLDATVPESLRQLIGVDPACELVDSGAAVQIGSGSECHFRLTGEESSAFRLVTNDPDPQTALSGLVDRLALQQIDATSIASEAGRVVDVQVDVSDQRRVEVWSSLFSTKFDFQESRACPIFVSRAIRWLANQQPIVPYVQRGRRLPVAAAPFDRATQAVAKTSDGRDVRSARMISDMEAVGVTALQQSPDASLFFRLSIYSWLGLLLVILLVVEWSLYSRGRIP